MNGVLQGGAFPSGAALPGYDVMTQFDSGDDDAHVNDGKPPPLIRGKSEKMATGEF